MKRLFNKFFILFFILSVQIIEASRTAVPKSKLTYDQRQVVLKKVKTSANQKRFEAIKAESALQGQHIPVKYNPEKMEAPIHRYTERISEQIQAQHKGIAIPRTVLAPMEKAYAAEVIDSQSRGYAGGETLGFNRVPVKDVKFKQEGYLTANPHLQKLSSGIEALHEIYRENPSFNQKYKPTAKTEFMSAQASEYVDALRQEFPHVPKETLLTYTTEFLNQHNNKYESGSMFSYDFDNKPVKTKPNKYSGEESAIAVTDRPELSFYEARTSTGPIRLQKLYDSMRAMEDIAQKADVNNAAPAVTVWSAPRQLIYEPQKVLNHGIQIAAEKVSSIARESLQPQKATTSPSFNFSPEALRAVEQVQRDIVAAGTEHGIRLIDQKAQELGVEASVRNPEAFAREALNASATKAAEVMADNLRAQTEPTPASVKPIFNERTLTAVDNLTRAAGEKVGLLPLPSTPSEALSVTVLNEKKKAPSVKAVEPLQTSESLLKQREMKNRKKKSPNALEVVTEGSSKTAQFMPKTQEAIMAFVTKTTESISKILGLSKEKLKEVQGMAKEDAQSLFENKDSWVYAQGKKFNQEFNTWMHKLTTKIYEISGKENIKYKSMKMKPNDASAPSITLYFDEGIARSAVIKYDGRSYNIDSSQIKFNAKTNTYDMDIPLKLTIKEKVQNFSIGKSIGSKSLGKQFANEVAPTKDPGTLKVRFDATNKTTNAVLTKKNKDQATITTTTEYDSKGAETSAGTNITNIRESIFESNINISSLGEFKEGGNPRIHVNYTNIHTSHPETATIGDVTRNSDGTYTVVAEFPNKPVVLTAAQQIVANAADVVWNKLIKEWPESTFTFAALKNKYPEIYKTTTEYLTGEYQTQIKTIKITYNPKTKSISTKTTQGMSRGSTVAVDAQYQID